MPFGPLGPIHVFRSFEMKFAITRLEDRIAPCRAPIQQAIAIGGGKGSKGGAGLAMAQQGLDNGNPFQQAIAVGGGKGSKGGAGLVMAQQGFEDGHPFQQAIVFGGGKGSKGGSSLFMVQQGWDSGHPFQQAVAIGGGGKGGFNLVFGQQQF